MSTALDKVLKGKDGDARRNAPQCSALALMETSCLVWTSGERGDHTVAPKAAGYYGRKA